MNGIFVVGGFIAIICIVVGWNMSDVRPEVKKRVEPDALPKEESDAELVARTIREMEAEWRARQR